MPPIAELIQQGSINLWLFIPSAILLGALHGLEPGHSKTMMASFIIAIRGSIGQAVLLGLCAALSHSLIVWLLAALALHYGNQLIAEQAEPYLMLFSAVVVMAVAAWMLWRTWRDNLAARAMRRPPRGGRMIDTGHGLLEALLLPGAAARVALYQYGAGLRRAKPDGQGLTLEWQLDGRAGESGFETEGEYLLSPPLPAGASVSALRLAHGGHAHRYPLHLAPGAGAAQGGAYRRAAGSRPANSVRRAPAALPVYQDAHERAHAEQIQRRFAGREVGTAQIALFGLTGGLIPCPASVTILLLCLHLKRFSLGATMVLSFSLGLALALVSVGVLAAWGVRQAGARFGGLGEWARRAPYLSAGLMLVVGLIMAAQAARGLAA
ncbi:nickel/cobalt exporter [Chromobacterium alkanivorans]|uniref:HoxN/HupN/NixA family nickel/cobalt transporter n=1 Tax=Chromobacterium alkanivorans TaxID=1071719 RepID=UPI002167BB18|nr:nickel/cobalt efflux protein RcnA [Chromobacterium alkanivorans]MCS3805891.1 nickel/cobalt exporter [Chromobacterium alkanivorans]MCS3820229.1 nickel/cobalt exporter [Chromobacterium alkanivorans]MCS3874987.1 nickel/cobalt exporter [Chromobacterium alkanivorans]